MRSGLPGQLEVSYASASRFESEEHDPAGHPGTLSSAPRHGVQRPGRCRGPSPLDPPTPQITSVRVTPTAYMVAVGSTTEMTVAVLADWESNTRWHGRCPRGPLLRRSMLQRRAHRRGPRLRIPRAWPPPDCRRCVAKLMSGLSRPSRPAGIAAWPSWGRDRLPVRLGWVGSRRSGDRGGSTGLVARWGPNRIHASGGQPADQMATVYRPGGWVRYPLCDWGSRWHGGGWTLLVA